MNESVAVRFSTALSLIEVGLGSLLHAIHFPFRGQVLSMNQAFLLSRASFVGATTRGEGIRMSNLISLTAACLKSLSPAGQKLTPMLAISVQGLLFSLGQFLGGVSLFGHSIGMTLVWVWALGQGLVLGWFLNGGAFFEALRYLIQKIGGGAIEWVILGWFTFLFGMGVGLVILSRRLSTEKWARYEEKFRVKKDSSRSGFRIPWVSLLSVGVTIGFLYATESAEARSVWIWIRPVGVFVAMWFLAHWIPPSLVSRFLSRRWPALAKNIESAHRAFIQAPDENLSSGENPPTSRT